MTIDQVVGNIGVLHIRVTVDSETRVVANNVVSHHQAIAVGIDAVVELRVLAVVLRVVTRLL